MHQTLVFGRDVAKSKDARRVGEPWKIRFSSRLAEFSTALKLLRITDQWRNLPVKFRFGLNRFFLALLLFPLAGGQKMGSVSMPIEDLISSASFHTSSDNCERNTQKWNSNNKDYKKETIEALMWLYWGDLVKLASWGRLFCNSTR